MAPTVPGLLLRIQHVRSILYLFILQPVLLFLKPGSQQVKLVAGGGNASRLNEETLELGAGTARCPRRMRARPFSFWFPVGGGGSGRERSSFVLAAPFPPGEVAGPWRRLRRAQ